MPFARTALLLSFYVTLYSEKEFKYFYLFSSKITRQFLHVVNSNWESVLAFFPRQEVSREMRIQSGDFA